MFLSQARDFEQRRERKGGREAASNDVAHESYPFENDVRTTRLLYHTCPEVVECRFCMTSP